MGYVYNLGLAFESLAFSQPERPALVLGGGRTLSYGDLDRLANRLAHWLRSRGVGRRDVLGLFNGKTGEAYASMLAALKIGAAYVNFDDQNPPQRLARILATCRPRLVIADHDLAPEIEHACAAAGTPVTRLPDAESLTGWPTTRSGEMPRVTGGDPAYLMFTSGSTGNPKGVVVSHASVLNFIPWAADEFGITPQDVLTGVNPPYFDNSVFDFYASLFTGAALAPIGRDTVAAPRELVRRVGKLGCTLWFSVPSLLIYLMTMRQLRAGSWPALRCVVFGGEGYPKRELKKLFDLFHPTARLVNVYGPTECTCICSAYTLSEGDFLDPNGLAPLGKPAANVSCLLLKDADTPARPGEVGELCLLGPQLAIGYYNDAERTAISFATNPRCMDFPERMYRTGDLVRQDEQGLLYFVGRIDNQIKHLGYRIELEEIEAALQSLPQVTQAVAIYQRVREQHGRIVAFVGSRAAIDESALRDALHDRLPAYMIPGHIAVLAELPRNANGKADRQALAQRLPPP
ncbi:amino acid adenylation domain-containing protein [Accumulibacter sp.]|uniref:amino acid adenylation domain-containing protein n=1 Tax=Accumulibacter sp. TaxID=2053492 RepID=UPI00261EF150|nr:amino acid adenylation domain-containing protein [Accumulibacter sp.]